MRYEELLMDIFGNLLESNLTLLNHFYDVHQQVMELASTQPTIYQILASLKHAISAEVTFFGPGHAKQDVHRERTERFRLLEAARLESERYQSFTHYRAILEYEDGHARSHRSSKCLIGNRTGIISSCTPTQTILIAPTP